MNREIKFRFRYTDGKNWIMKEFTLEQILNGEPYEALSDNPLLKQYKMVGRDEWSGLPDKHDKPIYEGDIVKCYGEDYVEADEECPEYDTIIRQIRYFADDDYAAFDLFPHIDCDSNGLSYYLAVGSIEVIGNIHEDPELLEKTFDRE